jgi:hypothetical protein
VQFACERTGRAIVDDAFDFPGIGSIYIYPRAPGGFENAGQGTVTVPGVLAFVRIPEYSYFSVAILSFQGGFTTQDKIALH